MSIPSMRRNLTANIRTMSRDYTAAVQQLNLFQSGYKKLSENRENGGGTRRLATQELTEWLKLVQMTPQALERLNIIHVAGTKGKGSSCAYIAAILIKNTALKIGLYTSPHLIEVRERIRIDGEPISRELFAKYFFEVWDILEPKIETSPGYFRFLTLLSFYVFWKEEINVCVYETGVGGELDATNVILHPISTGITTLGHDHPKTLGEKIEDVAWHKGGIFKENCPAFTLPQVPEALAVLQSRATEKKTTLHLVKEHPKFITLETESHRKNASLAIALANTARQKLNPEEVIPYDSISDEDLSTIKTTLWAGRFDKRSLGLEDFYLDGAHNEDSIRVAADWYCRNILSGPLNLKKILIFNLPSKYRDGNFLLKLLHQLLKDAGITIEHAIFTTSKLSNGEVRPDFVNNNSDPSDSMSLQEGYATIWRDLEPEAQVEVTATVEAARKAAICDRATQVFVVGSIHLVGAMVVVLEEQ